MSPKSIFVVGALLAAAACRNEGSTLPVDRRPLPDVPPTVDATPPSPVASASVAPSSSAAARPAPDTAIGGRLFDKFYAEPASGGTFKPDASKTAGKADGSGGPKGDGTLLSATGAPVLNDAGHDYRLKSFFGWDLKGREGIYGPDYMNKAYAVEINLLAGKATEAEIAAMLKSGKASLPAYGQVLDEAAIEALAAYVVATRERRLPHPDDIFTLKKGSPGNYALVSGGDAKRGKELFASRCLGCHGTDGTKLLFDDGEFSLGSHARQKAYEDWHKIAHGHPGSVMGRQIEGSGAEATREILDLLAALCDRGAFPKGKAKAKDVANGDARCGAYLR